MSVQSEISRITKHRNRIRTKLIAMGMLRSQDATLAQCTEAIESISSTAGFHYETVTAHRTASPNNFLIVIKPDSVSDLTTLFFARPTGESSYQPTYVCSMFATAFTSNSITFIVRRLYGNKTTITLPCSLTTINDEHWLQIDTTNVPYSMYGHYYVKYTYMSGTLGTSGQNSWESGTVGDGGDDL